MATQPILNSANETINWKTYTNEKYGFEFKYISSYLFRESSSEDYGKGEPPLLQIDLAKDGFTSNNTQAFSLSVNNLKYGSIKDRVSSLKKEYNDVSVMQKNINGNNFTVVSFMWNDLHVEAIYIEHNGLLYTFNPSEETRSFLDTFEFTKPMTQGDTSNWKLYPSIPIYYDSSWTTEPIMYRTPAQEGAGEPLTQSGIIFTLPSGAKIGWGGPQSACNDSYFPEFVYGVSKVSCIAGSRGEVSARNTSNFSAEPSQVDKNAFGDFVLKNK